MAQFSDRTDEVEAVCCQQAGNPNACGADGAPTRCDYECSVMFVPWFNECHELIEVIVSDQLPEFDATYRQCQNQDPHDILREIHELTDQGCSVQLPAGEVPSVATTMLDRELCSENGAPITPISCSASTEYNDACAPTNSASDDLRRSSAQAESFLHADGCENVFDGAEEDGYYSHANEGGQGTAGTSWATKGAVEGNGAGSGAAFHASITLNFGSPKTFGSMIFAQRNNVPGECFGRVRLTFDGANDPSVPLTLQCSPDMVTYR
eukprot:COSAG04_NODE_100_length_26314_cov_36.469044_22_plen_266_part_00